MSRFYGSIEGSAKTAATRQGSEASGINAHIRGWNLGVRVMGFVDAEGKDGFTVWVSSGSNASGRCPRFGFTVKETADGFRITPDNGLAMTYDSNGARCDLFDRTDGKG